MIIEAMMMVKLYLKATAHAKPPKSSKGGKLKKAEHTTAGAA